MIRILASISVAIVFFSTAARADDWPQWLGPNRDGVWREKGIVKKFPADGPPVLWRHPVAEGYAGPSVANGKVYVADWLARCEHETARKRL